MAVTKIGIMGTHGTGKTTFAMTLAADLKREDPKTRVGLVSEVARSCPFEINENAGRQAQAWIFHQQFVKEIEAASRNDIIVCDRTVLDALAYSQYRNFKSQVDSALHQALDWMATYDNLSWLRPTRLPEADGCRSTSLAFQRAIDDILADWIQKFGLTVHERGMSEVNNNASSLYVE